MQDPILRPPLPTPDGRIEEKPFDAAEVFARPWPQSPWPVRCAAFLGILVYGTCSLPLLVGGLFPRADSEFDVRLLIATGVLGLGTAFWLRHAFKNHSRAAWRLQAALWLLGLLFIPIGTVIGLVLLWMWDERETRAWFGLRIKPKVPRRSIFRKLRS